MQGITPFIALGLTMAVSFVGYVQLDNRQQEIRLTVVESEVKYLVKRVDLAVKTVQALALRQDKYLPRTGSFEEDGP